MNARQEAYALRLEQLLQPGTGFGPQNTPKLQRFTFRRFRVEVDVDGAPFVWEGDAINEKAAIRCAAHDLAVKVPMIEVADVQATSCVEVSA